MTSDLHAALQPQSNVTPHTPQPVASPEAPPQTWPYRLWTRQAQQLYTYSDAQRLALLHHLTIKRQHAATAEQALWLDALGRDLDGEVMHD